MNSIIFVEIFTQRWLENHRKLSEQPNITVKMVIFSLDWVNLLIFATPQNVGST